MNEGIRVNHSTQMQEAGAHEHAYHVPHPTDYAPCILTMKTSLRYCCYLVWGEYDNCSDHLPYLCTQEGYSQGFPQT